MTAAGGTLTIIAILASIGLIALAIFGLDYIRRTFERIRAEELAAEQHPWGDVVEVHHEARGSAR